MKNWNDFLTEYMLRAMTNREFFEEYSAQHITEFARQAWDAIQAAELPESEKAKQAPAPSFVPINDPAPIPPNSKGLKVLAEKALNISIGVARYIAIDKLGTVYAYKQPPIIKSDISTCWDISDLKHDCWLVDYVAAPDNFRNELYEISKILSDDVQ